ncbi:MAG: alpha/beta hydrolase [Lamprocystis purpurea]|jgi:hypothetical protein|uniref:hypothetical protein n=1 Tax=Lamprocystis purpurea TaxID=61598 RepID=UPI0012F986C6|nr:hypothetical protein [Lamprocystis purpurea]MBV5273398.1 alpha/beta hydrolase [Lamprocystis purpurea]
MIFNLSSGNKNIVYTFIHGAYDSPWAWSYVIDELQSKEGYSCLLLHLDQYKDFHYLIENHVEHGTHIRLVGFSLGAIAALTTSERLSKNYEIELFLVSTPLINAPSLIRVRKNIAFFLHKLLSSRNRSFFPLFLRGKIFSNPQNPLLELISENYSDLICKAVNCKKVHIYSGRLDFISGGIQKQKTFTSNFASKGIAATFTNGGFTGHFPYLINRSKLISWLLYNAS